MSEATSALSGGMDAKMAAAAAFSARSAGTSAAEGDFTFNDLKERLMKDMIIKFDSSAWFGG